ncbi:anthranilate synthase component I [Sorangium sp. So ce375]
MKRESYVTRGGVTVNRVAEELAVEGAILPIIEKLDTHVGVVLTSNYEYPGRYTRWDIAFVNPPLVLVSRGSEFRFTALNERGRVLLPAIERSIQDFQVVASVERRGDDLMGVVRTSGERVPEELRSRQPSIFSVLRRLTRLFGLPGDRLFGLYGAFAYDLAFQFEPIKLRRERPADQRDLVLYLPDEIVAVDHRRERATRTRYEFTFEDRSTDGLPRTGAASRYVGADRAPENEYAPGEYAELVRSAREAFKRGDLFEVVPSQTLYEPCPVAPTELFRRLCERNPAPYGFLMNLGSAEYLIGASPEMYVRVDGDRVETCPISGTIPRGSDPLADAKQIARLLASEKDESELTMCTDVDRNDKSRICVPGSVRVIGRRQIEMYSRLIHTVDHVEGRLREGFDALDAFLAHAWAVTVTGAPKPWAMQFIEDHERSPRAWYGAAVGMIGFDGGMNTGLTLRTIRVKDGVAQVRVGATLLFDSDPDEEERETHVKASALLDAIRRPRGVAASTPTAISRPSGRGRTILLVDHQDSFVHTLANYLRQTGADVVTLRAGFPHKDLDTYKPDLVVLSPGPGSPSDFALSATLNAVLSRRLPVFGVCLGLQGIVEHFGGKLAVLDYPMHGKASNIRVLGGRLFDELPREFRAGRYHSLHAMRDALPASIRVTAESEDGVVMAIEHAELPIAAVQFHPESILTQDDNVGLRLMRNAVTQLRGDTAS